MASIFVETGVLKFFVTRGTMRSDLVLVGICTAFRAPPEITAPIGGGSRRRGWAGAGSHSICPLIRLSRWNQLMRRARTPFKLHTLPAQITFESNFHLGYCFFKCQSIERLAAAAPAADKGADCTVQELKGLCKLILFEERSRWKEVLLQKLILKR